MRGLKVTHKIVYPATPEPKAAFQAEDTEVKKDDGIFEMPC